MSYSQNREDLIVREILQKRNIEHGMLLEVGAWNGLSLSNSRLLIEGGWSAVLVEPSPRPVSDLVRLYGEPVHIKDLPEDASEVEYNRWLETSLVYIIAAIVSVEPPHLQTFYVTDDAVSTTEPEHHDRWMPRGGYYGSLLIPTIQFDCILNQFGGFQFVSIDTEGTSVDLTLAYWATGQRPAVMCVEHDNRLVELLQAAFAAGYKVVATNGENVVLEYGA